MAELPVDLAQLVDAARTVFITCGSATITQTSAASAELQMQFATPENATKFTHAMGDLFRASGFLSCSTPVVDHPALEFATATLEAPPTKPLDVEVRQWAVERVERMPLYEKMDITTALWVANIFVQYAMTGTVPPDAPLSEDPA